VFSIRPSFQLPSQHCQRLLTAVPERGNLTAFEGLEYQPPKRGPLTASGVLMDLQERQRAVKPSRVQRAVKYEHNQANGRNRHAAVVSTVSFAFSISHFSQDDAMGEDLKPIGVCAGSSEDSTISHHTYCKILFERVFCFNLILAPYLAIADAFSLQLTQLKKQ
jgi:hypothetical protein